MQKNKLLFFLLLGSLGGSLCASSNKYNDENQQGFCVKIERPIFKLKSGKHFSPMSPLEVFISRTDGNAEIINLLNKQSLNKIMKPIFEEMGILLKRKCISRSGTFLVHNGQATQDTTEQQPSSVYRFFSYKGNHITRKWFITSQK